MRLRQKVVILLSSVCFYILGSLSKGVFERRRMSTGSKAFYIDLLICLDVISLYVSLGVSTLKRRFARNFRGKQLPKNVKSAIAVVVFAKSSLS